MKLFVEVHGCALNRGEAGELLEEAERGGHEVVEGQEAADLLMLVTCTVVQSTENRMLDRLRALNGMGKPVVVAGCMAAAQAERVRRVCPGAILVPPRERSAFLDILRAAAPTAGPSSGTSPPPPGPGTGPVRQGPKENPPAARAVSAVIEDVPIADGCRGKCSYCITRIARGELRSRPSGEVVARVRELVGRGCREVRLTAQDGAVYGADLGTALPKLLGEVCAVEGDFRVRAGMMNPGALLPLMDGLMEAYRNPKMFRFLHVPVQSGDDGILERMGRGYRASDFLELARRYREAFPQGLLATDVIVGFPGEGEGEFDNTVHLIEETRPDIVNVKMFSPRPGTAAASLKGAANPAVSRMRTKELARIHSRISVGNNRRLLGRAEEVLVTEKARKGGAMGRTADYYPVIIGEELAPGSFQRVRIVEARKGFLLGELDGKSDSPGGGPGGP